MLLTTTISPAIIYGALGALILAVIVLLTKVINDKALAKAITDRVVLMFLGSGALTFEKLKEHDIFIKLDQYANAHSIETSVVIEGDAKKRLYDRYCNMIAEVWLVSMQPFLNEKCAKMSGQQIKALLVKQRTFSFNEYDRRFSECLLKMNPDKQAVRDIIEKLAQWRIGETDIIMQNGIEACSGGGIRLSNTYRIDRIFTVYSLGVDVLFKNGADSFNRLNGELDSFLDKTEI